MFNGPQPTLFVIVGNTPGGGLAISAANASAAAQVGRQLTEYRAHTQDSWRVNQHASPGPVLVFGSARTSPDDNLFNHAVRPT